MTGTRKPVVAGTFYPARRDTLTDTVAACIGEREPAKAIGGIVPHAGYIYSGPTCGAFFAAVEVPAQVILLGPKHTYAGADYALWSGGAWETPLGEVTVDEELASAILERCPGVEPDESAHFEEHSLEVILPFIQYVNPDAKVVPIAFNAMDSGTLMGFGEGIATVISDRNIDALIVVSSDMSHYVSAAEAERLDRMALAGVEKLDATQLVDVVRRNRISMCGVWPAAVGVVAARALGAERGEVIKYTNSGEASGDYNQVVGYAAVKFD
ncbi:MAG: AmmeMemoRadiSam system protein B [Candidatus Coatesbacteria bacterium]|nr:MAG: AmmeMemoRadiSam system protein B [Candidatus Coatesbacteria bacterium]